MVSEGLGRRNGDCASIWATSPRAGTDATSSAAPSLGVMPPSALGTMVIVPPSERKSRRGLAMAALSYSSSRFACGLGSGGFEGISPGL